MTNAIQTQGIRTFQPKVTITLVRAIEYPNGAAQRYVAANNKVDLTPYLGEGGAVVTYKDITQRLGTFSITFADKRDQQTSDSVYALVSPMDYIEIRMAREAWCYSGKGEHLPIVMRGFVTNIERVQKMGSDGRPERAVVIQGQDFGKLLAILQIFYQYNYELGQNLLTLFKLSENFPVTAKSYKASDFMRTVLDHIVNPKIKALWHASAVAGTVKHPLKIHADLTVQEGSILVHSFQAYKGDLWGLLRKFADLYWNELFIEDRDDGVYLVYRPLPFKDLQGKFIAHGSDPGSTVITPEAIRSLDVRRTDADVANFYWVNAPHSQLLAPGILRLDAYFHQHDYFLKHNKNVNPELYGIRKMEAPTEQAPTNADGFHRTAKPEKDAAEKEMTYNWINARRERLIKYNKDNVVFESGELVLQGNEHVRPGRYINIDHGTFHADYYAQAVTQTFIPFQEFSTRARFIRGTGFLERVRTKHSSYLAERGGGAYG